LEKFQMKKTLVAIAALSAVSAFAQVTIDGYMDRGYLALSSSDATKNLRTIGSNSGTTTLGVKYYEDLGGGLNIGGQFNTDWATAAGGSQSSQYVAGSTSGFANSQSFLKLESASMGALRLGIPNNFTLTNATAIASPEFSTGVGSTYSDQFSIANGLGTGTSGAANAVTAQAAITAAANAGHRAIRFNNTYQYTSPTINGFTFGYGTAFQNNNITTSTGPGNTVGVTEYMLRYTNGPIDAAYTSIKYDVGSNGVTQARFVTTTGTPVAGTTGITTQDNTQSLLGVKYTVMPNLKLNLGLGTFASSTNTYKGSSRTLGGTYTSGAFDFLLVTAKVDDTSTTDTDRKMTGLGVNYNLSKTSKVYYRYDTIDYGTNVAALVGSTQKRTAIGLSKSF